ncbi:MAG TPA: pyrimidine dimer DNA glycosylase/endonuclease V [Bacteroidia bacterium]|jgi:hypothetical protein|nr:pyrimidine dimer DNA glycosylase/endonuclease V [Bacteroidia bacterium]
MRIWSVHPKYLDTKGLVALWRETLLAKHVLEGKTKGYKNHPQLNRFKKLKMPTDGINCYLASIYTEAVNRNYNFSKEKIDWGFKKCSLRVTKGQLDYEVQHLLNKLKTRDKQKHIEIKALKKIDVHPMFKVVEGDIEDWEIT